MSPLSGGFSPVLRLLQNAQCNKLSVFQISGEACTTIGCLEGDDATEVNRELCYF